MTVWIIQKKKDRLIDEFFMKNIKHFSLENHVFLWDSYTQKKTPISASNHPHIRPVGQQLEED